MLTNAGSITLKHLEGLKLNIYKDIADYTTIGYGHVIKPQENELKLLLTTNRSITEELAESLFIQDVEKAHQGIINTLEFVPKGNQLDALIMLIFNVGAGAFRKSKLCKLLKTEASFENIVTEWLDFNHFKEVGTLLKRESLGLTKRRLIECLIFFGDAGVHNDFFEAGITSEVILALSPMELPAKTVTEILTTASNYVWEAVKDGGNNGISG